MLFTGKEKAFSVLEYVLCAKCIYMREFSKDALTAMQI